MATTEEVKKLAALARIEVSEADIERFTREFDAILAYVGQIEGLELPKDLREEKPILRNVMRSDDHPQEVGAYTERLVAQFPSKKGNALSVKQIINHEKSK